MPSPMHVPLFGRYVAPPQRASYHKADRLFRWLYRALVFVSSCSSRWHSWLRTPYGIAGIALVLGLLSLAWPVPDPSPHAPHTLHITDRHGVSLRTIYPNGRHRPMSLQDIDTVAVQALIATEDKRFYMHPGIDPLSVLEAARDNLQAGRVVRGASTLTMQVAKTLRGSDRRSWWNKLAEAHLAVRLELRWSKDRIIETWLNRVSFGNRAHGIEAAARLYFGTSARDLTPHQSTYLVGLPQRPSAYNPYRHPDRAARRQQQVLGALVTQGTLTPADSAEWAAVPLRLRQPEQTRRAPHFTTALLHDADADRTAREWRTTLDAALQARIEARVRTRLHALRNQNVTNAAVVVLDNASGAIRAYVGSRNFWNADIDGQNDGVRMQRQPGSTLKPFLYGHTLDQGTHTPASILPDIPLHVPSAGGAFTPTNYDDQFHGPVSMREALAASYNVPAVYMTREIGPPALLATLRHAGFDTLTRTGAHYGVGLALGNGEVRLLDLAEAYAGLARGGRRPTAHARQWTRTADGDTTQHEPVAPEPLGLTAATTAQLTDMLSDAEARTPGFGIDTPLELPFPVAAKTGTSKDYRDNWTVGYTPQHTVAVWVGNFDGSPMQNVSGVSGAGPIFHDVMRMLGSGGAFATHPELIEAPICPDSGARPGAHCPITRTERFQPGTVPQDTCHVHRRVQVDRRTGTRAPASTPERYIDERLYTVHPPEYHDWMREHGLPLPPASEDTAQASQSASAARPDIVYPTPGTRFIIDPVLRAAHQRVHLRGHAPDGWTDLVWTVDGERVEGTWTLSPGRHTIVLSARDARGVRQQSAPVPVVVHQVQERNTVGP